MNAVYDGPVVVLPVEGTNQIDVFTGVGWTHWSRFQIVKGHPRLIKGESMSDQDFQILCGIIK